MDGTCSQQVPSPWEEEEGEEGGGARDAGDISQLEGMTCSL